MGGVFLEPPKVTFTIKIKSPAEKWLRKYDREIQRRFAAKIRKLQENPDLHGKPLRGLLTGTGNCILRENLEYYIQLIIKNKPSP